MVSKMASTNVRKSSVSGTTYEGGVARKMSLEQELERSVLSCLLWENEFYESGTKIADRIAQLVAVCNPEFVAQLAIKSRQDMKIRHVGLHLIRELVRRVDGRKYAQVLETICQRPDDMTEFLSLYWKDGKQPLAAAVKRALGNTFQKFSEYQLAKYDRDGKEIRLRDVLFMVHGKPKTVGENRYNAQDRKLSPRETLTEHEALYKRLVDGELASPETWENRLSRGEDKKLVWTTMMQERELGTLAFIRNIRNMEQAGVDSTLIREYGKSLNTERILPFQFITAARINPKYEDMLEQMMFKCMENLEKLPGHTKFLIDVSGSMDDALSAKSEVTRIDVACGLAVLGRELCESVEVFSFSSNTIQVPPRRGFALRDAILRSQPHMSTYLGRAVQTMNESPADRLIVLTDEQSNDRVGSAAFKNSYMINVASAKKSVSYGSWVSITGWSEAVMKYIQNYESL